MEYEELLSEMIMIMIEDEEFIQSFKPKGIKKIKAVGIFQAEKYYTTRSMIIIIHTRDNI